MLRTRSRKRRQWMEQGLTTAQVEIALRNVEYYGLLEEAERRRADGFARIFLGEKRFEGCGGLELTEEMRVTIAVTASLLLLGRDGDVYPLLMSVLVYPQAFVARVRHEGPDGVVSEGEETRTGESWSEGSLVLSWADIVADVEHPEDGYNVIVHEFAHQLDDEGGACEGVPVLVDTPMQARWAEVFRADYEALVEAADHGLETVLDPYGAESPAEFFAVATEAFFCLPLELENAHAALYDLLRRFYGQDPAARFRARGA